MNATTPKRTYSSSEAIVLEIARQKVPYFVPIGFAYFDERGTTIAVNRSYFAFQSFTKDLKSSFSLSHLLMSVIALLWYSNQLCLEILRLLNNVLL